MAQSFLRSGLGRVVLALMLITLAPALLLIGHMGNVARHDATRRAMLHEQEEAVAGVKLFEEMLASVGRLLEAAAAEAADWGGGPACVPRAAKLAAAHPFVLRLVVVAKDGTVLCTSEGVPSVPVNLGDRPTVRRAHVSDGMVIGEPVVSRLTGEVVLPVAHRVPGVGGLDRSDKPAILSASLDLTWLARVMHEQDSGEASPLATIIDANGRVLATSPPIDGLPSLGAPFDHPFTQTVLAAPVGSARVMDFTGRDRLVGFAHTYSTGLVIAVAADRAAVIRPINDQFLIVLGLMAVVAALGLGLALAVARARIGRPLLALAEAAETIRDGAMPSALPDHATVGEIAVLHHAFRRMAAEITRRQAALEAANSELEAANRLLTDQAERDALTGLANRRAFDRALEAAWRRGQREALPVAVLILDIDFFKQFNDLYGHLEGDACLTRLGRTLARLELRPYDLVARLGGEEFAVLLPDIDLAGAVAVGERIRAALHDMMLLHEGSPHGFVTVSIGAASMVPLGPAEPRVLLAAADRALYAAKAAGRDRVSAGVWAEAA